MTEKEESEFGKGLVVCLCKFSEHFMNRHMEQIWAIERWLRNPNRDNEITSDTPTIESFKRVELKVSKEFGHDEKYAFSHVIEMWAYGATDHLYNIQVPKKWEGTELAKKVTELQELGLSMGHSFSRQSTFEDIRRLRKLVEEISLEIDKKIGIKDGDWGQW
jgi:hypothetical protein